MVLRTNTSIITAMLIAIDGMRVKQKMVRIKMIFESFRLVYKRKNIALLER